MRRVTKGLALGLVFAGLCIMGMKLFGQDEKIPKDMLVKKNPVAFSDAVLAKAKKNYTDNCLQCHGETGKGDGPMAGMLKERPADLSDGQILAGITDGQLYWAVTKGKKPVMAEFESKLTNDERWGLVHVLRDLSKTKPNNSPRARR